ncbi:putative inorganic phosphate cotransporter isoform X2 [Macrobrachium nipponense]|uniref:putative inorganic phosphate cotransporter isoform X2 n=1 Tax=Macrobrachium nipponense TaxID=159736 RepID=UPI0030C7D897
MKMENSGSLEGHWNEGAQFDDEDDVTSSKDRSRVSSIPAEVMIQGDFLSIPQPKGWGCRHTLVVLGFTGLCVTYLNRINLSIAIVAMVAVNSSSPAGNDSEICPFPPDWNATSGDATIKGEFDWDPAIQGILLGCFFYGYAVSNFFGGLAVERYGSRIVLAFSVFVSSLASIVSPICARTSIGLFIGARVLSGLAQGPVFPCIHNLLATWNPPQDRARFGSVLFPGVNIGTILTLSLGGLMNESDFLGGWPSIFYVFGVLGILWCIPWLIFMRDSPQKHPKISREELNYIEAQGSTVRTTVVKTEGQILTVGYFWSHLLTLEGLVIRYFRLVAYSGKNENPMARRPHLRPLLDSDNYRLGRQLRILHFPDRGPHLPEKYTTLRVGRRKRIMIR